MLPKFPVEGAGGGRKKRKFLQHPAWVGGERKKDIKEKKERKRIPVLAKKRRKKKGKGKTSKEKKKEAE